VAALLLAAALVIAACVHFFLLPPPAPGGDAAHSFDSEEELAALRRHPSPAFCALPRPPLVCAHGGDAAAAPPNTLRAFQAALDGGADCVEVDVSMTKDGQLVVLHDRELAQLTGAAPPPGPPGRRLLGGARAPPAALPHVADFTWEQLAALRWDAAAQGDPGDRVPDLHSVLRLALPRAAAVTIDVKLPPGGAADAVAQAVVDALRAAGCGPACMVWAKSDAVVATVKALAPSQRVGLVVTNDTAEARAAGMHRPLRLPGLASVVGVHYGMATAELAAQARGAGLEVHVWTANSAGMMRAALDAGPDAVVTGHPRKLLEALRARREACGRVRRKLGGPPKGGGHGGGGGGGGGGAT
jgi:glycerophosphoryl diester phosphodiesterase